MENSTEQYVRINIPTAPQPKELPSFDCNFPADVRYDNSLSPMARIIYCEIRALSTKYGFCYARNAHFERCFGIDARTVQRILKELQNHRLIMIYKAFNEADGKIYRIIRIAGSKFSEDEYTEKNATKMSQKTRQKCRKKSDKNVAHEYINNNINNINLNKIQDSSGKVKKKFNDFSQRDYDYDSLEAALLNRPMRASP